MDGELVRRRERQEGGRWSDSGRKRTKKKLKREVMEKDKFWEEGLGV